MTTDKTTLSQDLTFRSLLDLGVFKYHGWEHAEIMGQRTVDVLNKALARILAECILDEHVGWLPFEFTSVQDFSHLVIHTFQEDASTYDGALFYAAIVAGLGNGHWNEWNNLESFKNYKKGICDIKDAADAVIQTHVKNNDEEITKHVNKMLVEERTKG